MWTRAAVPLLLIGSLCLLLWSALSERQQPRATSGTVQIQATPSPGRILDISTAGISAPAARQWSLEWAPKAQALTYVAEGGVYVASAPDFAPTRVATQHGTTPLWSGDGGSVAFAGSREAEGKAIGTVWLASADGSSVRDLLPGKRAELSASTIKQLVAWIDDRTLSFTEHMGTGVDALLTVDVESGETRFITGGPDRESRVPNGLATRYYWSPDRRFVVADAWGRGLPESRLLDLERRIGATLTNGDGTRLDSLPRWNQFRDWAPDSRVFIYVQWPGRADAWPIVDEAPDLYLWDTRKMDARSWPDVGEILIPHAYQGSWSPDGRRIAFLLLGDPQLDEQGRVTTTDFQPGRQFSVHLGILDVHTRKSTSITLIATGPQFAKYSDAIDWFGSRAPKWAPDGEAVAYLDGAGTVFVSDAEGRTHGPVLQDPAVTSIQWSADGELLAVQVKDRIHVVSIGVQR